MYENISSCIPIFNLPFPLILNNTYRIFGLLTWKEEERPNHIATTVSQGRHRRGGTLLGEARDIGCDHGESNCDRARVGPEDQEAEDSRPKIRSKLDEQRSH